MCTSFFDSALDSGGTEHRTGKSTVHLERAVDIPRRLTLWCLNEGIGKYPVFVSDLVINVLIMNLYFQFDSY